MPHQKRTILIAMISVRIYVVHMIGVLGAVSTALVFDEHLLRSLLGAICLSETHPPKGINRKQENKTMCQHEKNDDIYSVKYMKRLSSEPPLCLRFDKEVDKMYPLH